MEPLPEDPKPSKTPWIILGIVIIVCGAIITFIQAKYKPTAQLTSPTYSAVFLTNGEVYFGSLQGDILSNAYSLQANASGTPALFKVSDAIYQPTGKMELNPSTIDYIEPLSSTSPVIKTIK